jgi:hypothetical protein
MFSSLNRIGRCEESELNRVESEFEFIDLTLLERLSNLNNPNWIYSGFISADRVLICLTTFSALNRIEQFEQSIVNRLEFESLRMEQSDNSNNPN